MGSNHCGDHTRGRGRLHAPIADQSQPAAGTRHRPGEAL